MHPFKRIKTEEQVAQLSYELAIARAKVYKKWGFTLDEIACLVDLPEAQVQAELDKEIENDGPTKRAWRTYEED